jgi:hypothetical protein
VPVRKADLSAARVQKAVCVLGPPPPPMPRRQQQHVPTAAPQQPQQQACAEIEALIAECEDYVSHGRFGCGKTTQLPQSSGECQGDKWSKWKSESPNLSPRAEKRAAAAVKLEDKTTPVPMNGNTSIADEASRLPLISLPPRSPTSRRKTRLKRSNSNEMIAAALAPVLKFPSANCRDSVYENQGREETKVRSTR